jgi:DNA helicase-2/ATP-dependent DNA helicase PcrA
MSSLRAAIEELKANDRQWEAFTADGHCAVLAPPGSGKTKLLTTKVAYDLASGAIVRPQGAACITMTNEATLQLRKKLAALGIGRSPNLFIGTVHAFALACVVIRMARPAGREDLVRSRVASSAERSAAFSAAFESSSFRPHEREEIRLTMNKARQLMDLTGNRLLGGEPVAAIANSYQNELAGQDRFDFHDLVRHAVDLVTNYEWIATVLAATYPRVYVDEYQDLPPGLDKLVRTLALRPAAKSTLFAVGDPDQAIFGFAGTQPDLLHDLASQPGVSRVFLEKNYRCGQGIVDLSIRALGEDRAIIGNHDGGSVELYVAPGGEEAQTSKAVDLIVTAHESGVAFDQIAVVAAWGQDRDRVADQLRSDGIPVYARTDRHWGTATVTMLLEAMASWASRRIESGIELSDLLETWKSVVRTGDDHEILVGLVGVLLDTNGDAPAWGFVDSIAALALRPLTDDPGVSEDARELDRMRRALGKDGPLSEMTVTEIGDRARAVGRVMATTIHAAKGLEFDTVVMVGADNACLPGFTPSDEEREEARRKFYVSMTRARNSVYIVHTDRRISRKGRPYDVTPSPFIAEMGL